MRRAAAILSITLGLGLGGPSAAVAQSQDPARVEKERATIRKQLDALKKDIERSEGRQANASDALKQSEAAISAANRRLAEIGKEQKRVAAELDAHTRQLEAQETQLAARQAQLGELLRGQLTAGGLSPWGALLSGNDPQESQRNLQYLGYISRARAEAVETLQRELAQIEQLRRETQAKRDELAALADEAKKQRETRVRQTEERRKVLARISGELAQQQKQAANLMRDEKRLTDVIDRLTRMLAEQAEARARAQRAEAARRAALARREAERNAQSSGKLPPATTPAQPAPREAPVAQNALLPDPSLSGQFVKLKGRLSLPVRGSIIGRFGQRRDEGGAWRGVFIQASEGSNVHAVAPGKVVFADWMRGFGNLLIIDHGSQYLTIYANNQSILRHVGDDIKAGDVVAQVGATGGQSEAGLYFEMRHQGKPIDPMAWARLR